MKIPVNPESVKLPMAPLIPEQKEEEVRYLLSLWKEGKLSRRETAEKLGMTYRDFGEFASKRGYSVVGEP